MLYAVEGERVSIPICGEGPELYKESCIAIVIPCHNERDFVPSVLSGIPDYVDEVVLVDDCSSDGTLEVMRSLENSRKGIHILRTDVNLGVGGATLTGYRYVLSALPDVDVVVKMDGDGQMPPDKLDSILEPILCDDYDYSKGNRFMMSKALSTMPGSRLFGNFVLTFMTKYASGYWNIFDVQNGFTAIRRQMLEQLDLDTVHQGYFFENDMLVHLNCRYARVKDVALPAIYGDEVSGINIGNVALTFPFLLFKRYWWRIYNKYMIFNLSPVAVFTIVGTFLFASGAVNALRMWVKSAATGEAAALGTVMIALVSIILGFQMMLQGITLDIQESDRLR